VNPHRLYRSRRDRQLAGVAAGVAEYLEVDPSLVRVLWILSAFFGGFSILLYIVMAFVVPFEPTVTPEAGAEPGPDQRPDDGTASLAWPAPWPDQRPDGRHGGRGGLYLGVVLVVFGAIALADTLIPGWSGFSHLGPALLLALGVALLTGSIRRGAHQP